MEGIEYIYSLEEKNEGSEDKEKKSTIRWYLHLNVDVMQGDDKTL